MADFALWATAAESAIGLQRGEFIAAYSGNREAGNELALESSPVGKAILDFMASTSFWTGTAGDLISELDRQADEAYETTKRLASNRKDIIWHTQKAGPESKRVGVDVDFGSTGRGREKRRSITLGFVKESSVPNVPTSDKQGFTGSMGSMIFLLILPRMTGIIPSQRRRQNMRRAKHGRQTVESRTYSRYYCTKIPGLFLMQRTYQRRCETIAPGPEIARTELRRLRSRASVDILVVKGNCPTTSVIGRLKGH